MTLNNQQRRVLERLQKGPATTYDLVVGLGIMRAPARAWELKQMGYPITWTEKWTRRARIVTYTLKGQAELFPPVLEAPDATAGHPVELQDAH